MARLSAKDLKDEIAALQKRRDEAHAEAAPLLTEYREKAMRDWRTNWKNRDKPAPSESDIRQVLMKDAEPIFSALEDLDSRFATITSLAGVLDVLDEFDARLQAFKNRGQ